MATKFITIRIEIMQDKNLNANQKFILAEIEQLNELERGCVASNKHFSKLIGITPENVSKNIKKLEEMGYIKTEIIAGSRNMERSILLLSKRQDPLIKTTRPPYQNDKTPLSKRQESKENIVINKTINNTPYNPPRDKKELPDYLKKLDLWVEEVEKVFCEFRNRQENLDWIDKHFPNLNLTATLELLLGWWGTEAGMKNKARAYRKSSTGCLNWQNTIRTAITKNKVYNAKAVSGVREKMWYE